MFFRYILRVVVTITSLALAPFGAEAAMIARYTFDNTNVIGQAGAADISGNGNHLAATGTGGGQSIATNQAGVFGQAYQFTYDGSGTSTDPTQFENLLRTANLIMPTGTNPVTISVWFKQTAATSGAQNKLFGYGSVNSDANNATGEAMDIGLEGGGIRLRNYNGNITYGSGLDFLGANAGWHHLAVRVAQNAVAYSNVTIFLDGAVLPVSLDSSALSDTLNIAASALGVGNVGYNASLNFGFTGLLDEMRIYNTALNNAEIAALAEAPVVPAVAGISAFDFSPRNRVPAGSPVTLRWTITNATTAMLQPGGINLLPLTTNGSGALVVTPAATTTYQLSVSNALPSGAQAGFTVTVGTNPFPNIVFFLLDDFGWADWRQNGAADGSVFYETPRMDQLAAEGKWFRQGYAACNVCSPTRASILNGQIPAYSKVTQWISGTSDAGKPVREAEWTKRLPLSETTIAEVLRGAGYRTIHLGKWHMGEAGDPESDPLNQGFEVNFGGNHKGNPGSFYFADGSGSFSMPNLGAGSAAPGDYLTDVLTEHAVAQIRSCAASNSAFFLYLPHYAVHTPLAAPAATVTKYQNKLNNNPGMNWRGQTNPTYAAMIEHVDTSLGAIMDALRNPDGNPLTADSIAENTLIVFTSDNGGLLSVTSNRPLRRGKGHEYEGGVREPVVCWWPGKIAPGSVSDEPVISYDYFPTFLSAAQLAPVPGHVLHGQDLSPLMFNQGSFHRTNGLIFHYPHYSDQGGKPYSALRRGNFKSVYLYESNAFELYNVVNDPGEATNLAAALPELNAVLSHELSARLTELDSNYPRNPTTLNPLPPMSLVSTNDTDGDGMSDIQELIAGTLTNNPASNFRVAISNAPPVMISVPGQPGRRYTLQAASQSGGGWSNLLQTANIQSNQAVQLHDTNAPGIPHRNYRVGVNFSYE